jgi:aromatic ring hydroxylase
MTGSLLSRLEVNVVRVSVICADLHRKQQGDTYQKHYCNHYHDISSSDNSLTDALSYVDSQAHVCSGNQHLR